MVLSYCLVINAHEPVREWHWVSPTHHLQADAKFVDADTPREIFLSTPEDPNSTQRLCSFERDAAIFFSPDDSWIALNDN